MANDEFARSSLRTGLHLSFSDLPVDRDAEILIDGKPAKLTDLKIDEATSQKRYGLQLTIRLSKDASVITRIDAKSENAYFFLRGVDITKRVITVGIGASDMLAGKFELPVAKDTTILIGTAKSQAKKARFADLRVGMRISFELAVNDRQLVVRGIRTEE